MRIIKKIILLAVYSTISLSCFANLKYNPSQLDAFYKTNLCPGCDLSNAVLHGNHSSAILSNANLTNSLAYSCFFSQASFANANASGSSWEGNNFSYADFTDAKLIRTNLTSNNLEYANFSNAIVIGTNFSQADLYGAKITNSQLASAASICNAILPDGSLGKCD